MLSKWKCTSSKIGTKSRCLKLHESHPRMVSDRHEHVAVWVTPLCGCLRRLCLCGCPCLFWYPLKIKNCEVPDVSYLRYKSLLPVASALSIIGQFQKNTSTRTVRLEQEHCVDPTSRCTQATLSSRCWSSKGQLDNGEWTAIYFFLTDNISICIMYFYTYFVFRNASSLL